MRDMFGRIMKQDMFGNPISKKAIKREVIAENRDAGRRGEQQFVMEAQLQGYEVKRTGRGSDYRVQRRDMFTGRVTERRLIEVKTGNAQKSELQKKTGAKVVRYPRNPFGL